MSRSRPSPRVQPAAAVSGAAAGAAVVSAGAVTADPGRIHRRLSRMARDRQSKQEKETTWRHSTWW
jgi:hypothetical protein